MATTLRVHVYATCSNDQILLPHFLKHYAFAERIVIHHNASSDSSSEIATAKPKVEWRSYHSNEAQDNSKCLEIKNEAWKESRGQADFVIVCDLDEFLYHPNLHDLLKTTKQTGGTILKPLGFEMCGEQTPNPSDCLLTTISCGVRAYEHDKCILFDPNAIDEIRYQSGEPTCHPAGRVSYFRRPDLALLHYKYLSHDYFCKQLAARSEHLNDADIAEAEARFQDLTRNRRQVVHDPDLWKKLAVDEIPVKPENLPARCELGVKALQQANWSEALRLFEEVLAFEPCEMTSLGNVGSVLRRLGRLEDGQCAMQQALALDPTRIDLLFNLGNIFQAQKKFSSAIEAYQRALAQQADFLQAHLNLANAFRDNGNPDSAIHHYRKALRIQPKLSRAYQNLSQVLQLEKREAEAIEVYQQWLKQDPDSPDGLAQYGHASLQQGDTETARRIFSRAVSVEPDSASANHNIGVLLRMTNQAQEALPFLLRANELNPTSILTLTAAAYCLLKLGRVSEAKKMAEDAINQNPDDAEGHLMKGFALVQLARIDEAMACFKTGHSLKPQSVTTLCNLQFTTLYSDTMSPAEVAQSKREIAQLIPAAGPVITEWHNERDPERKLRIGYLSEDLRSHPVTFFFEPILKHHNPQTVEVFIYATSPICDPVTQRLQQLGANWREAGAWNNQQLFQQIQDDQIDILVDLAGHTAGNRSSLLKQRPAPIQALYIGYPATSGMEEIDYLITDDDITPEGSDDFYTETLMRQAGTFWCFRPHDFAPQPNPLPAEKNGFITFGSFNNTPKLTSTTIRLWSSVLKALPDSRLLMKTLPFADKATRQLFANRFVAEGVAEKQLDFQPPCLRLEDFMNSYHQVDIGLDPTPYNGGTTTCESLWMGVPVITKPETLFHSRMTLSFLKKVGLEDLAAETDEDFTRIAVELANDLSRLADIRQNLRQRMATSPICDGPGATKDLENSYRKMWQQWCLPKV